MENIFLDEYDLNMKVSKVKPPCQFTPEELEREIELSLQEYERGETLSHEEVMKNMDELIAKFEKQDVNKSSKKLSPFQRTPEELLEELNISLDQMEKGLTVGQEEIIELLRRYQ